MTQPRSQSRAVSVPANRLSRLTRLGSMTFGVAGNVAVGGLAQLGQGKRPKMRDLLLTPRNVRNVTEQLAKMRGAAMKIGQLVSMDTGDVLPQELAQIMARLRDDAHFMPPAQLKQVLNQNWGTGWMQKFQRFDVRPVAAASIGQVHRATLKDGRVLAIKVQYPGVAQSIDSDVANVGALIRMSGLLPKGFELKPYLAEARAQLHQETDYLREAARLSDFRDLLSEDDRFDVPMAHRDWSTQTIMAMDFVAGHSIETLRDLPQDRRDQVALDLIDLSLRELFVFGTMQTDPNFANFQINNATQRIALLDFGAVRDIEKPTQDLYRRLIRAGLKGEMETVVQVVGDMQLISDETDPAHRERISRMLEMLFDALRKDTPFDFADTTLTLAMQAEGYALAESGFVPPPVPMDLLFVQRKLAGIFLLAAQLNARVDLKALLTRYCET